MPEASDGVDDLCAQWSEAGRSRWAVRRGDQETPLLVAGEHVVPVEEHTAHVGSGTRERLGDHLLACDVSQTRIRPSLLAVANLDPSAVNSISQTSLSCAWNVGIAIRRSSTVQPVT